MENNSQCIEGIVDYISQLVSLNRRLQKKKVDIQTAKLAFTQLDTKRKGYLDLANVYQLCGNVTEDQLFYVFKWLDNSKTGDVTYDDFQWALVTNQANDKNQNSNPIDCVKLTITTYLQNFDYSQNLKKKLNITVQNLRKLYSLLCQSQRKSSLNMQDLVYVFSHSKKWDKLCEQEVKNLFRQSKYVSQQIFVDKFQPAQENQSNQATNQSKQTQKPQQSYKECNQEQLLDDINNEYLASRKSASKQKVDSQHNNWMKGNGSSERQNRFSQMKNTQAPTLKPASQTSNFAQSQKSTTQTKLGQIESMLSNIEKRRQQLRKGSLQRKKLIQQALSRKKTLNLTINGHTNMQSQQFVCSRPNSCSKQNSYSHVQLDDRYLNFNTPTAQFGRNITFNSYNLRGNTYNPNERSHKVEYKKLDQNYIRFNQTNSSQKFYQPELKNHRTTQNFYSTETKPFYLQNNRLSRFDQTQTIPNKYKDEEVYRPQTPKFTQTAHQRFFERPLSSQKPDRVAQIRQKINNLPDKMIQRDQRTVDSIIQKYKHLKNESSSQISNNLPQSRPTRQPFIAQRNQIDYTDPYMKKNSTLFDRQNYFQKGCSNNLENYENKFQQYNKRRQTPDSYLQEPKSRLNGSIYSYKMNSSSIQKQNLLKRAQQQAARKIQQIQRKAKMKVLQRKSAVGLKWIK